MNGTVCPSCQKPVAAGAKFCTSCGKKIVPTNLCPYCKAALSQEARFCVACGKGMGSQAPPDPHPAHRDPAPKALSPLDALLKRAALSLEDGEWQKADGLLEQALNIDPENAQTYFGKLLARLQLPSAKELMVRAPGMGIGSLKEYREYERALRFADPAYRRTLEGYDPANWGGLHQEARAFLEPPLSFENCRKAEQLLSYLPEGYKNTEALFQKINDSENDHRKYREAVSLLNVSRPQDGHRAVLEMLAPLPRHYTEAEALRRQCMDAVQARATAEFESAATPEACWQLAEKFSHDKWLEDAHTLIALCRKKADSLNMERAIAKISSATGIQVLKKLAEGFAGDKSLVDSDSLVEKCHKKIEALMAGAYIKGRTLMSSAASAWEYQQAATQFAEIPGYKDADELCRDCRDNRSELEAKERRKAILITSIVFALIALLITGIVIHDHRAKVRAAIAERERVERARLAKIEREENERLAEEKRLAEERHAEQQRLEKQRLLFENIGRGIVAKGSTIPFGGMEWRLLDVQRDRALLLSEAIIEQMVYHSNLDSIAWADSDMRRYLNGEFPKRFNQADMAKIAETNISTDNNPWHGTNGGPGTRDRVFLLSIEEVVRYFGDSGSLENGGDVFLRDQHDSKRVARDENGTSTAWWLRSPGERASFTACVDSDGWIDIQGNGNNGARGVRPAIWVNIQQKGA